VNQENEVIFLRIFSKIEDPRNTQTKNFLYPLEELLLIAFATLLCGGESYEDMEEFGDAKLPFFKTILPYKNGAATADTYERVFGKINPQEFAECLTEWTKHLNLSSDGDIISLDGKTVKGSGTRGNRPIHILNAWSYKNKTVLGCALVDEKSNEITAVPEVLKLLALKGATVTMDAMGCQREITEQIVAQGANYVISLKGNQGNLHDDVKTYFELEPESEKNDVWVVTEKGHGRFEKRTYKICSNIRWLRKCHPEWKTLGAIGSATSYREQNGKATTETRYFILNKKTSAERFAETVRAHWGIENNLHNFLDVAFHEDDSRVSQRQAAANLAILRRLVVNRIEERKEKGRSKRRMRLLGGWSDAYLKSLISAA
jgi:predicted transposase YbfD/YdcC